MADIKGSTRRGKRREKRRQQVEQAASLLEPSGPLNVTRPPTRLLAAVCLALCLAIAIVYLQTSHYGFVAYDDDQYVYQNPHVQGGLTGSGIAWAWTTPIGTRSRGCRSCSTTNYSVVTPALSTW
jgi:hypothetical protein